MAAIYFQLGLIWRCGHWSLSPKSSVFLLLLLKSKSFLHEWFNFTCVFIVWFILFEISLIPLPFCVLWKTFLRLYLNFCFLDDPDPDDGFNYKQMMVRDERRFKMADKDGDLIATKEEFTAFLHPEEYDYMKDIVVQVGKTKGSQPQFSFFCCLRILLKCLRLFAGHKPAH